MELTGLCKQDFEKWLLTNYKDEGYAPIKDGYYQDQENKDFIHEFNIDIESKRYGVLVDFFNSVGIQIGIEFFDNSRATGFDYSILTEKDRDYHDLDCMDSAKSYSSKEHIGTRPEARIKAIEKVNELYNKK